MAGQLIGALFLSHYYWVVAALQIAGGVLLLANRFVPLALVLLGPIIVNIICYHVFLNHSGACLAAVVTILWLIVFTVRGNTSPGYLSNVHEVLERVNEIGIARDAIPGRQVMLMRIGVPGSLVMLTILPHSTINRLWALEVVKEGRSAVKE